VAAVPLKALPFSWLNAVDFSQLEKNDCFGTCSKYKANSGSQPSDALQILKAAGINAGAPSKRTSNVDIFLPT
jgi:hypothetical protein